MIVVQNYFPCFDFYINFLKVSDKLNVLNHAILLIQTLNTTISIFYAILVSSLTDVNGEVVEVAFYSNFALYYLLE